MSKELKVLLATGAVSILPLVSTSLIGLFFLKCSSLLTSASLLEWFLLSIVFAFLAGIALITPTFLALILGYFIGYKSIPFLIFINLGAILLVYLIVKRMKANWINELIKTKPAAENLIETIKDNELSVIFFTKISPILPFTLTNICFGLSGAKLKNILLGGFAGMLPRTILAVAAGVQSKNIQEMINGGKPNPSSTLVLGALIIISLTGLIRIFKK